VPIASLIQSLIPASVKAFELFEHNSSRDEHKAEYYCQSTHTDLQPEATFCGIILAQLRCAILRLHLDADALEKGSRQNSARDTDDRVVLDFHSSSLLLDLDVVTTDPLDTRMKQDVEVAQISCAEFPPVRDSLS